MNRDDRPAIGGLVTSALSDALSRSGGVPAVDIRAELVRIGELVTESLAALDDEHEGDFTRGVLELHTHAANALHVVATW